MKTVNFQFVLHWVQMGRRGQGKDCLQYLIIDFFLFHLRGRGAAFGPGQGGRWFRSVPGQAGWVSAQLELILESRMGTGELAGGPQSCLSFMQMGKQLH